LDFLPSECAALRGAAGAILVNDNPRLPVLAVGAPFKANAKMLATIMALESLSSLCRIWRRGLFPSLRSFDQKPKNS